MLTANISRCFSEYCRCLSLGNEMEDRVSIMHQSYLRVKGCQGNLDISLFYRFLPDDDNFVHNCTVLFPLLFIEFTKTATKTVDKKLPQAAAYANLLFRLMKFDEFLTWVPLLGIVMSESEMLFRLYSPTLVENEWKIAEVDVLRSAVSTENIERLLHIMAGWTVYCKQFLCSSFAASPSPSINGHLLLHRHRNVVMLGNKVFKSFDYRTISNRSCVHAIDRRDPMHYLSQNDLTDIELVVSWTSQRNPQDSLQIIAYNKVPGVHCPSFVGHLTQVMCRIAQLHASHIVHGDLRFSNIVFSEASDAAVKSTIIDFDYSGPAGEKLYPVRFNPDINDGFRHAEARACELLQPKHDIAALHWMCAQYHPKNVELRETWSWRVSELLFDDILNVANSLTAHVSEELEPVDENMVISMGIKGTGSPNCVRAHYK